MSPFGQPIDCRTAEQTRERNHETTLANGGARLEAAEVGAADMQPRALATGWLDPKFALARKDLEGPVERERVAHECAR